VRFKCPASQPAIQNRAKDPESKPIGESANRACLFSSSMVVIVTQERYWRLIRIIGGTDLLDQCQLLQNT
jgi:hypothetical protein